MKKYLALDEEPKTEVEGEKPIWIDIADNKELLTPALEHMKKYLENDKKNEITILYDKMLSRETKEVLEKLKEPRRTGGFGWKVMEERLFHGLECDSLIYVGSGHLEAFTRARLKLFVITFAKEIQKKDSWYKQYQAALMLAAEHGLVQNVTL